MSQFNGTAAQIENNTNKLDEISPNSPTGSYPSTAAIFNLLGDYVIECGEKDGWTYEKWNSGKLVCWTKQDITTLDVDKSSGNNFYGSISGYDFPVAFVDIPCLFYAYNGSTSATTWVASGSNTNNLSTLNTGSIFLFRSTSGVITGTLSIQAIGKWK